MDEMPQLNISPMPAKRGNGLYICTNCNRELRMTWGGTLPNCWLCDKPLKKKDETND